MQKPFLVCRLYKNTQWARFYPWAMVCQPFLDRKTMIDDND